MNLKEYIKNNYRNPNPYILEKLGASKELIEYLRTTPWNSNFNMLETLGYENPNKKEEVKVIVNIGQGDSVFTNESTIKTAKDLLEAAWADQKLVINIIGYGGTSDLATQFKHTETDIRWSRGDYFANVGLDNNGYYISVWYDNGD